MSRSLKIAPEYIEKAKAALRRNGYARQIDLAKSLGISKNTVWSFLNGKPVDFINFYELCDKLNLDYKEIADWHGENTIPDFPDNQPDAEYTLTELNNYIERPPIESDCLMVIDQPGSLLRIKAPKGMGRNFLLDYIIYHSNQRNYHTAKINLLLADKEILSSLKSFLRWFCVVITRELKLPKEIDNYWEEDLGSVFNCTNYLEEYILPQLNNHLVLTVNYVDRIFSYGDITNDFLAMFRAWFEKARTQRTWRKKLRLVLAYSTEELVQMNVNQSPFNVGVLVKLPEFNHAQIKELAQKQELDLVDDLIVEMMNLIGGHPSLVQKTIAHIKISPGLIWEQLLLKAPKEDGIYGSHLRAHLCNLQNYPELTAAMKTVVAKDNSVRLDSALAFKLESLGLIQRDGNEVRSWCNLYTQYFREML